MKTIAKINRETPNSETLNKLCEGSALTMLGYIPDELPLYIEALNDFIKNDSVTVYETTGERLSSEFEIDLPKDLNIFIVDLEQLKDIGKLAVTVRFQLGFRWLDDIIENSKQKKEWEA